MLLPNDTLSVQEIHAFFSSFIHTLFIDSCQLTIIVGEMDTITNLQLVTNIEPQILQAFFSFCYG